ncbi:alpha/beta fold hydrolase [Streptomyces sp. NBC_00454]|uniref:alpha/beta fold hydrolase n=1 Tax=Streptomyces sp. NBC_00454 TaxID=2975747 RepID=UPI0030E07C98
MTELHAVTANGGVRISYEVTGPADGPPVLLLPALGETAADWAAVRDGLARERRVFALDLRGLPRGMTPPGRPGRGAAQAADCMADRRRTKRMASPAATA